MNSAERGGFTIVELLIVIVVIGILAAITLVAFNGIRDRAAVASAKSDLANIGKMVSIRHADSGTYNLGSAAYKSAIQEAGVSTSGLSFAICAGVDEYAIADYRYGGIANGQDLHFVSSKGGVKTITYNASVTASSTLERICRQVHDSYTASLSYWFSHI